MASFCSYLYPSGALFVPCPYLPQPVVFCAHCLRYSLEGLVTLKRFDLLATLAMEPTLQAFRSSMLASSLGF